MKLAQILADLAPEELERLAREHMRLDPHTPHALLCSNLEGILRSFAFVQEFIVRRQPPSFSILLVLLESESFAVANADFREKVMSEATEVCDRIANGDILGRDEQMRLYRRVLFEARQSDLDIDPSESAILGVLRRELGISQVEHFLLEHHPDFQGLWRDERSFLRELNALRSAGLIFAHDGRTFLAEEVAPLVRQALGIQLTRAAARRLYSNLTVAELGEALQSIKAKTSGSKEEKLERLLANMVQPREVLRCVNLTTLRDLVRSMDAVVSGSKDELIERVIDLYARGLDQKPEAQPAPEPPAEPRALDEQRFRGLFGCLRGQELTEILASAPGLRQSGSKEVKIGELWRSRFSEESLLMQLTSRALENALDGLRLKLNGSKRERILRLVQFFAAIDQTHLAHITGSDGERQPTLAAESSTEPQTAVESDQPLPDQSSS